MRPGVARRAFLISYFDRYQGSLISDYFTVAKRTCFLLHLPEMLLNDGGDMPSDECDKLALPSQSCVAIRISSGQPRDRSAVHSLPEQERLPWTM